MEHVLVHKCSEFSSGLVLCEIYEWGKKAALLIQCSYVRSQVSKNLCYISLLLCADRAWLIHGSDECCLLDDSKRSPMNTLQTATMYVL